MTINVFEGARRIAKLAALIGVIWYVGYVASEIANARIEVRYQIKQPDLAPVRVKGCDVDDLTKDLSYVPTRKGGTVSVILCFQTMEFNDGGKKIPYRYDPTTREFWGSDSSAPKVVEYVDHTARTFVIPPADEDWIAGLRWPERWKRAWNAVTEGTVPLLVGLAFLWAFTWAVGWIVRGFLGIPRGKDQRTPEG